VCGICGIYHYRDARPIDQRLLRSMTSVVTHRGPDDDGFYVTPGLGLGMRRLSIIDLTGGGQPIANETGDVVTVFNGEIYNYRELRATLTAAGHAFATATDTETIVHAFERWGVNALAELNGIFGLAVWDASKHTLVLARDPFGVKPLYYHDDGDTVRFGSEIKSILCDPAVPRSVDGEALDLFLTFTYVPSPATAFSGIRKVPPGYALVCSPGGCELRRYADRPPLPLQDCDEELIVARLRDLIAAAVQRQMVADVPVGALLSGGVDSTATATIMSRLTDEPIDTFTVGFGSGYRLDELQQARATARRLGTRHHEIVVSADEYKEFLPFSVWHLEEPVATDSTLAYYKVCELAHESVKVVLTGQGADEPFAGYQRHLGERYGVLYRALPEPIREGIVARIIAGLPRNERLKRAVRSLGTTDPRRRAIAVWSVIDSATASHLSRRDGAPDLLAAGRLWEEEVRHLDGLSQMLYMDARLALADNLLMYGDKMSMAVSLEARVPFLDLELMRFVESLPPSVKIRRGRRKYILKRAVASWVPEDILRRRKVPFTPPIDHWLRSDLSIYLRDTVLGPGSACRQFFDDHVLEDMVRAHQVGREDYKRILLSLIVFELWHQQFIAPSTARLRQSMRLPTSTRSQRP